MHPLPAQSKRALGTSRVARLAALVFPVFCFLAQPLPASTLETDPDDIVARIRVEIPALVNSFLLKGTIPLPPGTYVPGSTLPLKILDFDRSVIPDTQIEVVTRFPDAARDGADVVELIARVRKHTSWSPGQLRRYDVVLDPSGTAPDPGAPGLTNLLNGEPETLELQGVPASVEELLGHWRNVVIVTTDPMGNEFLSFPLRGAGGMKTVRYGRYMSTLRTYETQVPRGTQPTGGYPHLFGIHAYLSTQSEEEHLFMDLRFNNGADRNDTTTDHDDVLGKVYFEKIDLWIIADLEDEWHPQQQFLDPFCYDPDVDTPGLDTLNERDYLVFPLVKPLSDGKMHMMPCRAQFHRRLALAPVGETEQALAREALDGRGQGFARQGFDATDVELWSWWNAETARYFPQNRRLPDLSYIQSGTGDGMQPVRDAISQRYAITRDCLKDDSPFPDQTNATGSCVTRQLGWARPRFHPDGGSPGGGGISFLYGVRAANAGHVDSYRWLLINHRLNTERQPNVLYGHQGDPTSQQQWLASTSANNCFDPVDPTNPTAGPQRTVLNFWFNWGSTGETFTAQFFCVPPATWAQNAYVYNLTLEPDYDVTTSCGEQNLNQWKFHDDAHLSRYINIPMALCWLGNDPIAKDDILMQAELFRLSFTEFPSIPCEHAGQSLFCFIKSVYCPGGCPGWGAKVRRNEGWGMTVTSAAYAMQDDDWRFRMKPWHESVIYLVEGGIQTAIDHRWKDPLTNDPYEWGVLNIADPDQTAACGGSGGCNPSCQCAWQDYRSRLVWQEMIVQNGLRGVAESVFPNSSQEYGTALDVLRMSLLGNAAPVHWNSACGGIASSIVVSGLNCGDPIFVCQTGQCAQIDRPHELPPGCTPRGSTRHYVHAPLADGFELIGDRIFLLREENSIGGTSGTSATQTTLIQNIVAEIQSWSPFGATTHITESEWLTAAVMLGLLQD